MRNHKLWTETIAVSTLFLLLSTLVHADIVFKSLRDDSSELYVMNDDGGEVRRLTDNEFKEGRPTWSPDGRYIAFTRDINSAVPGQPQQIHTFVMHADGSRPQNLTQPLGIKGGNPTWSPDGRHLAFPIWRNKTHDIAALDIASSTVRYLTNNSSQQGGSIAPCWSPDGRHIAYEQTKIQRGRTIYKMNANGKRATELLPGNGKTMRYFPRWSLDGKYILYGEREVTNRWFGRNVLTFFLLTDIVNHNSEITSFHGFVAEVGKKPLLIARFPNLVHVKLIVDFTKKNLQAALV